MKINKRTEDLTGLDFDRLKVKAFAGYKNGAAQWFCECMCGTYKEYYAYNLKNGHTLSCGCLQKERITSHKMSATLEYKIWGAMKQRCNNEKDKKYKHYGGRGIKVCGRWENSFINFLADVGLRPSPELSIDRIDNDGNYCLENCRWTTIIEQNNNQRIRKDQKWFIAINKELGIEYRYYNKARFVKEWKLNGGNVDHCFCGNRKSHRGWTFKYL